MVIKILDIFLNLGIISTFVAGLVWLSREIFRQIFNKDLEKFKSNLEKEVIEFKVRYEKIHGEKVEVIKGVYKKISKTYRSFYLLVNPIQNTEEDFLKNKGEEAVENINNLISYYEENRIFFSEELAKDIDSLLKEFNQVWAQFSASIISGKIRDYKEQFNQWKIAWKRIENETLNVKKELETKFRKIINI